MLMRSDAGALDHTPRATGLIGCSIGQRLELAVALADRSPHGGREAGDRRKAWRALGRGSPASTRRVQRQRKDEPRDEDDGSRGRPGALCLRLDPARNGVDEKAAGSPSRWRPDGRVGRQIGGADRTTPASRTFGLLRDSLRAGLHAPNELVHPFPVSTSRRVVLALAPDRTVPAVLRRPQTSCV